MERWSIGMLRFVAAGLCLSTDYCFTDYWLLVTSWVHGRAGARPYQSPFTFHFSPLPSLPRSINERTRGQYDNQNGSFGSDLPIR